MKTGTHGSRKDLGNAPRVSAAARRRLAALAALPDDQINLNDPDAPPGTDWTGAVQGKFYRPVKLLKSFRIDADVLAYFEAQGRGYQAKVNQVLREAMLRETEPTANKRKVG